MRTDGLKAKTLVLSLLLVFFSLAAKAQNNNRHDEPLSDEHYALLEKKEGLIKDDIAKAKNEWAGIYTVGDHHPTVFMWSPDQGYLAYGSNHTFAPSRLNFGKATFSNGILRIEPEIAKNHLNYQHIPLELMPVSWGDLHFLLEPLEMQRFAFDVHSGSQSQFEWYLAKTGNSEKNRTGLPSLPAQYLKIVTMNAIKPRIVSIGKAEGMHKRELVLDLGSKSGIIPHILFYFRKGENQIALSIDEVGETRSKATIHSISSANENFEPRVGMRFSSKVPAKYMEF